MTGDAALCQADTARVQQVIVNLLHNGIIYNRSGGTVTLNTQTIDGWAVLQVRDNGPGISQNALAHPSIVSIASTNHVRGRKAVVSKAVGKPAADWDWQFVEALSMPTVGV